MLNNDNLRQLQIILDKAYKVKIQNEINFVKRSDDLNLWQIYLFLGFLSDMYILFYKNFESDYKEPLRNLKNLLQKKYEEINKEEKNNNKGIIFNKIIGFNEQWTKKLLDEENIKISINKLEKIRQELNKTINKYEKNKFLHLDSLIMKYKKYKEFISEENKYYLGITLNGHCALIEDIAFKKLEIEILIKKEKEYKINHCKNKLLFWLSILSIVLSIISIILGVVALIPK